MEQGTEYVTLGTIAHGAVPELFQEEFRRVLENIADVNTEPAAKREILIKLTIRPNDNREAGNIEVSVVSRVASIKKASSVIYMGRHHNEFVALEHDPKQRGLFEERAPISVIEGGKDK